MPKTVKGIVAEYLTKNGFDGLCNSDLECGFDIRIMVSLLLFVETVRSLKDSVQNAVKMDTTADFEKLVKKTLKDCK